MAPLRRHHPRGVKGALSSFQWRISIPVPYPSSYDNLIEAARKARIELIYLDAPCFKKQCPKDSLRLTSWMVTRYAVVFNQNGVAEHRSSPVPLAVCESCGARLRVLPVEFLPRKTFSLPVIEYSCALYLNSPGGLRKAVDEIDGASPHFSTLHGWLGALGERVLDRVYPQDKRLSTGQAAPPATSSIVTETAKRLDPELVSRWTTTRPEIARSKYQSPFRKERLEACLKLILLAISVYGRHLYPLTQWQHCLITWFHVPGWVLLSRSTLTAIQLDDSKGDMVSCRGSEKLIRNRSP